jgi:hypothetical protein
MQHQIIITSNNYKLFRIIKDSAPTGITVAPSSDPGTQQRHLQGPPISIEFIINIDLHRIMLDVAIIYLLNKTRQSGGITNFKINGKNIPSENPNAKKIIGNELDKQ